MKKEEIYVNVRLNEILESGYWQQFCEKYGIDEWCINEGKAEGSEVESISLQDAEDWNLIED